MLNPSKLAVDGVVSGPLLPNVPVRRLWSAPVTLRTGSVRGPGAKPSASSGKRDDPRDVGSAAGAGVAVPGGGPIRVGGISVGPYWLLPLYGLETGWIFVESSGGTVVRVLESSKVEISGPAEPFGAIEKPLVFVESAAGVTFVPEVTLAPVDGRLGPPVVTAGPGEPIVAELPGPRPIIGGVEVVPLTGPVVDSQPPPASARPNEKVPTHARTRFLPIGSPLPRP